MITGENVSDRGRAQRDGRPQVLCHQHIAHAHRRHKVHLHAESVGSKSVVETSENSEHHIRDRSGKKQRRVRRKKTAVQNHNKDQRCN